MILQEISSDEREHINQASHVASYIFLAAVRRTADMLEMPRSKPITQNEVKTICEKHPQIVSGFMQTIATVRESDILEDRLLLVNKTIGLLIGR
jgi:hypothetical protein